MNKGILGIPLILILSLILVLFFFIPIINSMFSFHTNERKVVAFYEELAGAIDATCVDGRTREVFIFMNQYVPMKPLRKFYFSSKFDPDFMIYYQSIPYWVGWAWDSYNERPRENLLLVNYNGSGNDFSDTMENIIETETKNVEQYLKSIGENYTSSKIMIRNVYYKSDFEKDDGYYIYTGELDEYYKYKVCRAHSLCLKTPRYVRVKELEHCNNIKDIMLYPLHGSYVTSSLWEDIKKNPLKIFTLPSPQSIVQNIQYLTMLRAYPSKFALISPCEGKMIVTKVKCTCFSENPIYEYSEENDVANIMGYEHQCKIDKSGNDECILIIADARGFCYPNIYQKFKKKIPTTIDGHTFFKAGILKGIKYAWPYSIFSV